MCFCKWSRLETVAILVPEQCLLCDKDINDRVQTLFYLVTAVLLVVNL